MAVLTIPETKQREPKDLRYRRQFFPDADDMVFNTKSKGFVPLPIVMRKLMSHLTAPEFRVLVYLQLRASRHGICYPTLDEIVHDLGLTSRKNLTPHLEALEKKKFIATATASGKRFFLIYDPRVPIQHLFREGTISENQLSEINELYMDLGQEMVSIETAKAAVAATGDTQQPS